jgi:hypothetical protein
MSLEDIIYSSIEGHLRETSLGGMPAMIVDVSSYGDKQFVNVRPQISRLLETGEVISNDEITIYDVPVIWPSGGGAMLSFPLKVGDTVWLSFSQRNLEDWLYSDGTQEVIPGDSRHFSMTDAVAIPGLYTALSNLKPSTENVEIKFGNHLISLRPSGELYVTNGGAEIKLNPSGTITANGATITTNGNVITANGTNLDQFYAAYLAHVHPAKPPSSPSDFSGPPV